MNNEKRNISSSDPYPGLRPYHEDEQGKFFGRDADAEILIDKVLTNRLTLLFAASGVGKSSLLQAAVIPRLKSPTGENLKVVYHIDWVSEPLGSMRAAVLKALHTSGKLPEGTADEAGQTLAELLEFCGLFVRHPLVLILDQFEEFFRYQRATASFQPFIEQLTAVITNPQLPVSLVLSMREDFALELNAFKPRLPTILFENFYRLEKLGRVGACEAIVTPVEQVGFRYEPLLLEILLDDLLSRELDRTPRSPVTDFRMTIEPPYLQIVCSYLWEADKNDSKNTLRLITYEKSGKAKGILKNHLDKILKNFSFPEKKIISKIFDYLVGHWGVKVAYTPEALAKKSHIEKKTLTHILEKLDEKRILRKQIRDGSDWYELYHDIFSSSIEDWNNIWKAKTRIHKQITLGAVIITSSLFISTAWDFYVNSTFYHLHSKAINRKTNNIEIWKGKTSSFDFFGKIRYFSETGINSKDLEFDEGIDDTISYKKEDLYDELTKKISIEKRVTLYSEIGQYGKALSLSKNLISSDNLEISEKAIKQLSNIRTSESANLIYSIYVETQSSRIKDIINRNTSSEFSILLNIKRPALNIKESIVNQVDQEMWDRKLVSRANKKSIFNILTVLSKNDWNYVPLIENSIFSSSASELLIKNLKNPDSRMRQVSAETLGRIQARNSIHDLKALLNDKLWAVRIAAIKSLGDIHARESIPELREKMKFRDFSIRAAAIRALGKLNAQEDIPEIRKYAKDSYADVRKAAAEALIDLKSKEGVYEIKTYLLNDNDSNVRKKAVEALGILESTDSIEKLTTLLKDANFDVRQETLKTLKRLESLEITDKKSKELIRTATKESDYEISKKDTTINLNNEDTFEKNRSIWNIYHLNKKEYIPRLVEELKNENSTLQEDTATVLYHMKQKETYSMLLDWIYSTNIDYHKKMEIIYNINGGGNGVVFCDLQTILTGLKSKDTKTRGLYSKSAYQVIASESYSKVEKKLISKALNAIAYNLNIKSENPYKKLTNYQPDLERKPLSLDELKAKLDGFDQAYADWRERRDAAPTDNTATDPKTTNNESDKLADPAPFIYEYAYAIANMDDAEGIKLLGHNLAKVREAAARGLANSDFLGVPLLQKLEQEWLATDNPITRQGLFHAIDIALLAMEGIGADKELEALKVYEPTLTNERSAASIKPRVEWTRIQLQWRVDALKELRELADRQLPGLLKEYCLNPDGTDMKPEKCTIER